MTSQEAFQVITFREDDAIIRAYGRRRLHTKTKSGCVGCRAKRVKCDEARPVCIRCWRNKRQCHYNSAKSCPRVLHNDFDDDHQPAILHVQFTNWSHFSDPSKGTSLPELMHHLYTNLPQILHLARMDEVLELTRTNILVRKAVLAISAAHLHRVSPSSQHRIAEHFQQHCALQEYQLALAKSPQDQDQSGVNALVLTGGLLNVLAFTLPEPRHIIHHRSDDKDDDDCGDAPVDPSVSWTFEADRTGADWLCLQAGMHPMLHTLTPFLPETLNVLGNIFLGADKRGWAFGGIGPTDEEIPWRWARCFELDIPHGDPRSTILCGGRHLRDVLRPAVRILLHLRDLTASDGNVFRYLQFFGKLPTEFRKLLHRKDVRALWLYGYWLGLMCRFEGIWWCERRVHIGYGAVRVWLEQWVAGLKTSTYEQMLWNTMMEEFRGAPEHFISEKGSS